MTDSSGVTHTVQRHLADTIRIGNKIVWDRGNKLLNIGEVYVSEAPTGKKQATHWKLVVEGNSGCFSSQPTSAIARQDAMKDGLCILGNFIRV